VAYVVRKKELQEYEERIKQALFVLGEVSEDTTTPRNIRRAACGQSFKCHINSR